MIVLARHELRFAAIVGIERHVLSIESKDRNKVANAGFGWHTDIEAACAEMALAKKSGRYWDGSFGTFKLPDVGSIQVRHTDGRDNCLIVRGGDADNDVFCLMVGRSPAFSFRGWIRGGDAKREEFVRNPGGAMAAYFVPQSALIASNPFEAAK
jgi:hypothetical protein